VLTLVALLLQSPTATAVGRVTAVAWPGQEALAAAIAEQADGAKNFPGIGASPIVPSASSSRHRETYDSLTADDCHSGARALLSPTRARLFF